MAALRTGLAGMVTEQTDRVVAVQLIKRTSLLEVIALTQQVEMKMMMTVVRKAMCSPRVRQLVKGYIWTESDVSIQVLEMIVVLRNDMCPQEPFMMWPEFQNLKARQVRIGQSQ